MGCGNSFDAPVLASLPMEGGSVWHVHCVAACPGMSSSKTVSPLGTEESGEDPAGLVGPYGGYREK